MEDVDDEYSDDFEEDESQPYRGRLFSGEGQITPKSSPLKAPTTPATGRTGPKDSSTTLRTKQSQPWRRKGSRLLGSNKLLPQPPSSKNSLSPFNREASAYRHTINKLQNRVTEVQKELEESKKENKLLNRLRVRHEKALTQYQSQEGDLPQLLSRHAEEVRTLREHLKKSMSNSQQHQKQLGEYRQEVLKLSEQKRRLQEVASKKDLLGRDRLTKQLKLASGLVKDKDQKIAELERKVELMEKNRMTEVRALTQRNRTLSTQLDDLKNTTKRFHTELKAKEKNLNVMNMYTQRFNKVAQWHTSLPPPVPTASHHAQTDVTCPAKKSMSFHVSPSSSAEQLVTQYVQTDLQLDHSDSMLELKILSVNERGREVKMEDREVQTSSSVPHTSQPPAGEAATRDSVAKSSPQVAATAAQGTVQTSNRVAPDQPAASRNVRSGFSDLENEEKRKKEALLAKLRAIDGVQNPPESQPIQSTIATGSVQSSSQDTMKSLHEVPPAKTAGPPFRGLQGQPATSSQDSIPPGGKSFPVSGLTFKNSQPQPQANFQPSANSPDSIAELPPQEDNHFLPGIGTGQVMTANSRNAAPKDQFDVGGGMSYAHGAGANQHVAGSTGMGQVMGRQAGMHNSTVGNTAQKPMFGPSGAGFQPELLKRSSLANLSGGPMTSGSTNLGSLLDSSRRATVPSTEQDSKQKPPGAGGGEGSTAVGGGVGGGGKRKPSISSHGSHSSLQSWPDTIQNLHAGKPAYSSVTDPFGSRYVAASNKESVTSNTSGPKPPLHNRDSVTSNTFGPKPPLHNRDSVTSNTFGPKPSLHKESTSGPKPPLHGRRAGTRTNLLEAVEEDTDLITGSSDPSNKRAGKPRSQSENYPWEVPIDLQSRKETLEGVGQARKTIRAQEQVIQARTTKSVGEIIGQDSLLPLRPKQSGHSYEMSLAAVAEPDDLEEVTL